MKILQLPNGLLLPNIGFGTADLNSPVSDIVFEALRLGHRLIDTAQVYGSEYGIGIAIREAQRQGIVRREDLFVQTKLSPDKHGYKSALEAFDESLNKLQLNYVDMFLLHWPVARGSEETYREKNIETWYALEALKRNGKVRHIGVCNFLERHLLHLIEAGKTPEVNQLELHPGFQQRGLVRFCRERGIVVEAWSPMGRGILNKPKFIAMAKEYGKDTAQIALRWSIQSGFIPISRSSSLDHIRSNLNVMDFELSQQDMQELNALNTCDGHMDIWSYKRQQMY